MNIGARGTKPLLGGAAAAFLALGLVSSCGQSEESDAPTSATSSINPGGEEFNTPAEVRGQLPAALAAFNGTFPDTDRAAVLTGLYATFDMQRKSARKDELKDGPAVYERGAAEEVVLDYWLCSWEDAYITAHKQHDSAAMNRAGIQLATWYDLEYAKRWVHDPDRAWKKEVLDPAVAGDTRAMAAESEECSSR